MSENFRGAVLMIISMGAFVLNDAFVRLAGNSLPLAQILFIRGLITTVVLLFFAILRLNTPP
jgi:S-adenosylmethionine uptake transporter